MLTFFVSSDETHVHHVEDGRHVAETNGGFKTNFLPPAAEQHVGTSSGLEFARWRLRVFVMPNYNIPHCSEHTQAKLPNENKCLKMNQLISDARRLTRKQLFLLIFCMQKLHKEHILGFSSKCVSF